MNEVLGTGLLVMLVGMVTVFVILSFVVLSGKLLIRISNSLTSHNKTTQTTNPQHIAVITSIVNDITNGEAVHIKVDKK